MILQIRVVLIFLLVLLQFAAPLIHAHKNSASNFGTSIHLPEFEQVDTLLKSVVSEFTAPTNHDEDIVAISTGIKNETLQFLQTDNTIFVLLLCFIFMAKRQRSPRCFLLKTEPISPPHFLNLAIPRAPPVFYVR
jgi:hypothetical protein